MKRPSIPALLVLAAVLSPPAAPADRLEPFQGWRETSTEHFTFIYEPRDEPSVAEMLGFAEEVYEKVTGRFGYRPPRVPVVVRGRTGTANGFYTAMPHRIELFVTGPSGPWLGARGEGWLRLLLTHELSHYVHFTARVGLFGGLSHVFGADVTAFNVFFMSGWFVEGITTHNETLFSSGGRGRNPFFEIFYKAPILEGRFWSLKKAAYGSSFAPQERIYVAGWLLADHLTRQYGPGAYAEIHRTFARAPLLGVDRAVKKVTGVPAARIYESMKGELESRFASSAALPQGERLSPEGPGDWFPPRITKGGWFAYSWSHDGTPGIYRLAPDGRWDARPVFPGMLTDESSFGVSADGRRIVAARPVPDPGDPAGRSSFSDLWLLDVDAGSPRRLTVGRRLWHPELSPDGARIVAVERAGPRSRLVEVDAASGAVRPLYEPEGATVFTPRFDERGGRIVLVENVRGVQDIMLLEGGAARPLLGRDAAGDYYPTFSAMDRVLFSSDREGSLALYEFDLATDRLTRVVRDRVAAWAGVRTERGLLYASYASDGFCVRVATGAQIESVEIARPPEAALPPAPAAAAAFGSRAYRDWPRPLAWFPYVGLSGSFESGLDLPLGAIVYGAGVLQRHVVVASAAWNAFREQPELQLSHTWNPGPAALTWTAGQSFVETSDGWEQRGSLSASLAVPVWTRDAPASTAALDAILSASLDSTRASPTPFTVAEGFDLEPERELAFGALAEAAVRATAPPRALFGRAAAAASAGVTVAPALLDRSEAETAVTGRVRAQLPAPGRFAAAGLELRGALSSSGSVADLLPPRGGAPWEPGDGDAKVMAGVDWRQPFGLFDGRALGITMLAAGAVLSAEGGAYRYAYGWQALDDLYFGLELDASLMIFNLASAVALGVTARVDRRLGEPPQADDFFVYFVLAPSIIGRARGGGLPALEPVAPRTDRRPARRP